MKPAKSVSKITLICRIVDYDIINKGKGKELSQMNEIPWYFSLNVEKPEQHCYAIQELVDEHAVLKNKLDKLYHLASMLAYNPTREDRLLLLDKLYNALCQFKTELDPHSQKEDNYLFDMVAEHIGRDEGPIAVMEQDHVTAKAKLHEFLRKYKEIDRENPEEHDIRELTNYVSVIFHTLTDHFLKEEEILFPMAETILTDNEKKQLEQIYKEISIA